MKLIYFAKVREILGKSEEIIEVPSEIKTIQNLIDFLISHDPSYKAALEDKDFFVACDEELVDMDFIIKGKSEIAIFPPVTGG